MKNESAAGRPERTRARGGSGVTGRSTRAPVRLVAALVALAAVLAYLPTFSNGFVNLDDDYYVVENPPAQRLSPEGVRWAFTTFHESNWHPLTWLSHMTDGTLFGLEPWGHHATSLLLHAANAGLLVLVLFRMTGALAPSALAGALFALHPLNVESVAWVSERKNVLSTLFWILTMGAYARYAERPAISRFAPVVLLFTLGLMAKPMLVTLPFVLLLLDAWPLRRLSWRAVAEKAPLFALSAASCVVTMAAQHASRVPFSAVSLGARVANAAVSYVRYVAKAVAPSGLGAYYSLPGTSEAPAISPAVAAGAVAAIAAAAWIAWRLRKRAPHLLVGWLWYLGTLVPVIGLVQVGGQGYADRYAYVPLIGLFVAVAWSLPGFRAWPPGRGASLAALAVLAALGVATARQVRVWHDSGTLWTATLRVSPRSRVALLDYGIHLVEQGREEEGLAQFAKALAVDPEHDMSRINVGATLWKLGRLDEGLAELREVVEGGTSHPEASYNVGVILADQGKTEEARGAFEQALAIDPDHTPARVRLARILSDGKRYPEAIAELRRVLGSEPHNVDARVGLGMVLVESGAVAEGLAHYEEALARRPRDPDIRMNIASAEARLGRTDQALAAYREILRESPGHAGTRYNLGNLLSDQGRFAEAAAEYREAARLDTTDAEVRHNLSIVLARSGDADGALAAERDALRVRPDHAAALGHLALLLMKRGENEAALEAFRAAIRARPDFGEALVNQGVLLAGLGRNDEAIASYREAVRVQPGNVAAANNLGFLLVQKGRRGEAIAVFRAGLAAAPDNLPMANALAWLLATSPEAELRDGAEAVAVAERVVAASGRRDPQALDTLGAALAETGRFGEAAAAAREAAGLARGGGDEELARSIDARARLYASSKPFRDRE